MELVEQLPKLHRLAGRSIILDMLLHARQKSGIISGVSLRRGQVLFSERGVAGRSYTTYAKARTVLSWLEKVCFLTRKATRNATVATICDFDRYINDRFQISAQTGEQPTHDQRTTDAIRKVKVNEKGTSAPTPPDPEVEPREYINYCSGVFMKIPPTDLPSQITSDVRRQASFRSSDSYFSRSMGSCTS